MNQQNVLVTGSESMIGKHLINYLKSLNRYNVIGISHKDIDLTNQGMVHGLYSQYKPDYVYNLAGVNGNVNWSQSHQAEIFWSTSQIALNSLYNAWLFGIKKCVNIISSCAIADLGNKPLKAEELWNGLPNETIEAHGLAKRVWDAYSRQLYRQYGFKSVCAIVNNCYGPYDNLDISKTKAVMGIVKRFVDAKERELPYVECWGHGLVFREFVYANDAARALVSVMDKYDNPLCPLNISSKDEVSIRDLTNLVAKLVGYTGEIRWDESKPSGQLRKSLDITDMGKYVDFEFTPLEEGLKQTIEWYKGN